MRGIFAKNRFFLCLILFSTLTFAWCPDCLLAQTSSNWIDNFEPADKEQIEKLNKLNLDEDIKILGITNSLINDSIKAYINNFAIDKSIPSILESKRKNLKNLVKIYDKYLNGTKPTIDSIGVYASNVKINVDFVNQYKGELLGITFDNSSSDNNTLALKYMDYIQTQENIIFNQKQFFTFYSLANKSYLISKGASNPSPSENTPPDPIPEEPVSTEPEDLSPTPPQNNNSENFKYANVIINEEIVESIKVSLSEYEEDTNDLFHITSYDIESLTNAWDSYINPEEHKEEVDTTQQATEPVDSNYAEQHISEDVISEPVADAIFVPEKPADENIMVNTEPAKPKIESTFTSSITGLIYRVQIAASSVPLSNEKLMKRYAGSREIKMFQEENWYKYYIADCKTLKEAIVIKKESNVPDAFVMAYKDGIKIKYFLKYAKAGKGSTPPDNFIDLKSLCENKLVIVVQVAADREPLSKERLYELYQGGKPLNYIYEEGWHKYSFGNYDRFWPANFARRNCGTVGAFVVAYKNGKKYNLWNKENK